jgi:hypothetical protein
MRMLYKMIKKGGLKRHRATQSKRSNMGKRALIFSFGARGGLRCGAAGLSTTVLFGGCGCTPRAIQVNSGLVG